MSSSFQLIVISSPVEIDNEAAIVSQLFELGLTNFHLRKPLWTESTLTKFIEAIPTIFHSKIVLHTHFQLAEKLNLKGIHLSEESRHSMNVYEKYKIISTSFHTIEDVKKNNYPFEYVFLSPIFDSISKTNYKGKFDLKILEEQIISIAILKGKRFDLIALGGISSENIETTVQMGFSGAALLGAIWESQHPVNEFLAIQSKIS